MIKCPLCGWNNHESTQLCVSCGGDLERRSGLVRVDENCYSFTPPRRILDKGVGITGSGNDLVFRFSSSAFAVWLIVFKIILLAALPYEIFKLYRADNTFFYVLIPITLLYFLDISGWILLSHGGRKKKRKEVRLGLRLLYAFHAIGMAYCILTTLITIYFSLALGFSWNLGVSLGPLLDAISSDVTMGLMIAATAVLCIMVIFLNICAKFFHYTHDIFVRNSVKFYPYTFLIAVVFIIITLISTASAALVVYKENVLELVKEYATLNQLLSLLIPNELGVVTFSLLMIAIISAISAAMVISYIKSYKDLFVRE
ncbi:MAG: hypothetical protein IKY44_03070 [Clostridia bacterium]|nr:hypothetical protein [Clostridia bacterium]